MDVAGLGLVGRDEELRRLGATLADAAAGKGSLVLVAGEAGIGKSHLLRALATTARGRDFTVAAAVAHQGVETAPFALLDEAFPRAIPEMPRATDRLEFFNELAAAIAPGAADRPLLVVLDDLHWADAPSLRFLPTLALRTRLHAMIVAVAYRTSAVRRRTPLAGALAEMATSADVLRLELDGLSGDDLALLAGENLGESLPPDELEALHLETGGNPFFALELLRDPAGLAKRGLVAEQRVPSGIREAIFGRLGRLPAGTQVLLEAAAVLGGEFDLRVLAAMVGTTIDAVLVGLAPAEREAVIVPVAERLQHCSFCHPLIGRSIYEDLGLAERVRLHGEAARAIEALVGSNPAHLALLAHHARRATVVDGVEAGVRFTRLAADHAFTHFGYEDAARLYAEVLTLVDQLPEFAAEERAELLLRQAESTLRSGDDVQGREIYGCAFEQAALAGDRDRTARAALGQAGYRGTPGAPNLAAIRALEQALDDPPKDRELRARLASRLAVELYYVGDPERRAALATEAVALAREVDRPALLAQMLIGRHYALDNVENVGPRRAAASEAARLAEAAGDAETAMVAHYLLVRDLLEGADRAGADAAAERHRQLALDPRQPLFPWRVLLLDALFAHLDGDLDAADRLAAEAFRFGSAAVIPNAAPAYGGLLVLIRMEQGRLAELRDMVADAVARYSSLSTWLPLLALCELQAGDLRGARANFGEAMAGLGRLATDEAFLPTGFALADLAVSLADSASARRLLDRYAPYADRVVVVSGPTACAGPMALSLGRMAALVGERDQARAYLETAAITASRLRSPLWAAKVTRAQASLEPVAPPGFPFGLTAREAEVLGLVASGMTNREIAARLIVGMRTIDSHVATIYRKIGARRRGDAVAFAVAHGLVDPGRDP